MFDGNPLEVFRGILAVMKILSLPAPLAIEPPPVNHPVRPAAGNTPRTGFEPQDVITKLTLPEDYISPLLTRS